MEERVAAKKKGSLGWKPKRNPEMIGPIRCEAVHAMFMVPISLARLPPV